MPFVNPHDYSALDLVRLTQLRQGILQLCRDLGYGWLGSEIEEEINGAEPRIVIRLGQFFPPERKPE